MIKIVTFGFAMNGKLSYLRNGWNALDFMIVIISILDLTLSAAGGLSTVKVIRVLRILRPIRIVARNQSLQIALMALVNSMPKILQL